MIANYETYVVILLVLNLFTLGLVVINSFGGRK